MADIIIPPVSDCFMPTLGAAQLVSYLKENQLPAKFKCRTATADFRPSGTSSSDFIRSDL